MVGRFLALPNVSQELSGSAGWNFLRNGIFDIARKARKGTRTCGLVFLVFRLAPSALLRGKFLRGASIESTTYFAVFFAL